jgi:hypothetical protein
MTKLFAMTLPVLPGKTEQLKKFTNELTTTYKKEFNESRKKLGVQERTFLQTTPMGDMIIVTLEGNNPEKAIAEFGKGTDEFTKWFITQAKEIHGVDLSKEPVGKLPELVAETEAVAQYA